MPPVTPSSSAPGNYPPTPPWGTPLNAIGSSALSVWSSNYNGGTNQPALGRIPTAITLNGGATRNFGAWGRCITFDGSTGQLAANPPNTTGNVENTFSSNVGTAIFWFRTNGTPGGTFYWLHGNTGSSGSHTGIFAVMDSTGAITAQMQSSGAAVASLVSGAGYNDGNWHQLALIWHTGNGTPQKLYMDGLDPVSANTSGSWSMPGSATIVWAKSTDSFWGKFLGDMDPGAWFAYELPALMIAKLWASGPSGFYQKRSNAPLISASAITTASGKLAGSGGGLVGGYLVGRSGPLVA